MACMQIWVPLYAIVRRGATVCASRQAEPRAQAAIKAVRSRFLRQKRRISPVHVARWTCGCPVGPCDGRRADGHHRMALSWISVTPTPTMRGRGSVEAVAIVAPPRPLKAVCSTKTERRISHEFRVCDHIRRYGDLLQGLGQGSADRIPPWLAAVGGRLGRPDALLPGQGLSRRRPRSPRAWPLQPDGYRQRGGHLRRRWSDRHG